MTRPFDSAEAIFRSYFLPLYPPDARADLGAARATDANPAANPAILRHLDEAAELFVRGASRLFDAPLDLDFSDASVHRLGAAITPAVRDRWASRGDAGTPDSELFNAVVHGAAYVGACVVRNHAGAWAVRRPLWESLVTLESRAGIGDLAIFQWWLKSLTDEALGEGGLGLADRYRTHVENPTARPEDAPVFLRGERKLPRLAKVRYDLFYKYLKANLPEVRDLGADFPSPERFDELGFKWLDFRPVGEGRMLALVGLGQHGAHMFWLDAAGFQKAAFFPCDGFPEPVLKEDGEKLQLHLSVNGANQTQEMLWWGP